MTFHTSLLRVVAARLPILPFLLAVSCAMNFLQQGKFPYLSVYDVATGTIIWIVIALFAVIMAASSVTFEGDEVVVKKLLTEKRAPLSDFIGASFGKRVIIATPKGRAFVIISIPKIGFSPQDWHSIVERLKSVGLRGGEKLGP